MIDRILFVFVLEDNYPLQMVRRNARILIENTTAYPFRLPRSSIVCVYCAKSFDDSALFRNHMKFKHDLFFAAMAFTHIHEGYIKADCTELFCRKCHIKFPKLEEVAKHLNNKHDANLFLEFDLGIQSFVLHKNKYECAFCPFKSSNLRSLSRHTQSHFVMFICDSCGKSYPTAGSLKCHIKYNHSGLKPDDFICRKCGRTFGSIKLRREHLSVSPKCCPHVCDHCSERFMTYTLKTTHMKDAHGVKKKTYTCPECQEMYYELARFRAHFQTAHTDNYACFCCELKFGSKRDLENHTVAHTQEKLFPCTVCSKSFARKKNLAQHMWIHNEHKRFGCSLCNKLFNQRVSWRTHMKSHHPGLVNFDDEKDVLKHLSDFKLNSSQDKKN